MRNFSVVKIMKKLLISIIAFILCSTVGVALFSASNSAVAAEAASTEQYNFVFICPNKAHEYWTPLIEGMGKADEKLGTHTEIVGPDSYDEWDKKLVNNLQAVLERPTKPDGILVRGVDGTAELIDRAVGMGIPVITVDTDVENSSRAAFVGSDSTTFGKKAAQAVVAHMPEGCELGMVMTSSDPSDSQFEIRRYFENIVSDYGMTITATAYLVTNSSEDPDENEAKQREDTVAAIKEMLTSHPDVKAVFATGAVNAAYTAQAKEELGRDDLFIVGQDDIEDNLAYVRSGTIHAIAVQRTDLMGYLSVLNLKKYIDEGSLPKKIYDTGITLVTEDNIDTYKDFDEGIGNEASTVKVGYYDDGEPEFQDGFSDGARKSGYAYDYLQALAPFAGWKYEYVYGAKDEIRQKLLSGEVDIMAGVPNTASGSQSGLAFSDKDMGLNDANGKRYFAVKKENTDLLKALNYAMEQMDTFFPVFTLELYQKYYGETSVHTTLSNRETQWLIERNMLTFGYVRDLLPFSGQDKDGNPTGLTGELVRSLAEFTEIDIVPVCFETVADLESALRENTVDVGFPARYDLWVAENKGLKQSDSVLTDRIMIIYHGAYTGNTTSEIAVSKTTLGMKDYLVGKYPSSTITEYDNFNEMVDAVRSGNEQCAIGYSSILQRVLSEYDETDELNISYLDASAELCLSVNQNNAILTVILNKMINQIDGEVITGTLLQYASVERSVPEITFADFFKQYAYIFAIVLVMFVVILALIFAFYIMKSRQHSRQQAEMQVSLQKAVETADSANKAKTNFLSSMSHDIRTPMNAIVGMTDIAKKHRDDKEKLNDCLEKITLSSQHLLTLINDILDISKIESGKFALTPINFSLCKLVDNLVNIVRPMIKAKEQEFDVHIHDVDCEMLHGDELRISQVFINILSNAVKYTPDGGKIVLDLREERLDEKTVRLTYTVRDNGIGMSPEYMERMYDAFTRADDSRTNKIQGTGLGLAIVKQMVMLMNGTIDCESEPDKGTVFTVKIELPVGEADDRVYTLPPVDMLLVDDDEVFLTITEDVINEMGARAETACGGKKAIELVKSRHDANNDYAVVIVDWKMPEISGVETVRAIRNIVGANTSIILVSAYDWSDIEDDAKNSGADGFISKPLFKSYLSEKIGRMLKTEEAVHTAVEDANDDLKGLNVLVAEDNELNWEVISELLDMYGITVERAENGKIALEKMDNAPDGKYDLILMDVQMPVINGKEATAELRKSSREYVKNIPIIAMTADAFAEDIASCLAVGMDDHISKPVDMVKTCQAIRSVLKKRKG